MRPSITASGAVPEKIKAAIKKNKLVLVLGAGLSKNAGLPLWNDLIDDLKTEVKKLEIEELKDLDLVIDPYLVFDNVFRETQRKESQHKGFLNQFVRRKLHRDRATNFERYENILENLKKLTPHAIVSLNVDTLLIDSQVFSHLPSVFKEECHSYHLKEGFICHLHGSLENTNWVLTDNERSELYNDRNSRHTSHFLLNLFGSYTVLFLGFSFSDKGFLDQCLEQRRLNQDEFDHFALIAQDSLSRADLDRIWEHYGVQSIKYNNEQNMHEGFEKELQLWANYFDPTEPSQDMIIDSDDYSLEAST